MRLFFLEVSESSFCSIATSNFPIDVRTQLQGSCYPWSLYCRGWKYCLRWIIIFIYFSSALSSTDKPDASAIAEELLLLI